MNRALWLQVVAALLCAFSLGSAARAEPSAPAGEVVERYALLVGCTEYRNCNRIPELWGPANDVPMFGDMLATLFGFAPEHITQLVGWPDDESLRPTHANIVSAFEDLISKAGPQTQIVILMSGHGTQVPIPDEQEDPTDPANPEPDGMDEVFLPADVRGWEEDGLERAIRDDQVGRWLDAMQSRGAAVWIVFDCCHSGTMTRGGHDREVHPLQLGIPEEQWARARAKATPKERTRSVGRVEEGSLDALSPSSADNGSVVAFYAAQSFEKAPELPQPSDAPRKRENYFGLLTYNLSRALRQRAARAETSAITYRELGRLLIGEYRAERGSRGPTPFFHGDLDREVLGTRSFAGSSPLFLEKSKRDFQVSAGELAGLTPGTILAIDPPGRAEETMPLGYAIVKQTTPTTATVDSCEFDGQAKVDLSALPEACRCRVVQRDLGDMRIKLHVVRDSDAGAAAVALDEALATLPTKVAALFRLVDAEDQADWIARAVMPGTAQAEHGSDVEGPTVLLVPPDQPESPTPGNHHQPAAADRVFAYPAGSAQALIGPLARDLQRIFTWHNVWRIAGGLEGDVATGKNPYFRLQVTRSASSGDESDQTQTPQLKPGDDIELLVENTGREDLWVTILFLAGNFEIAEWWSGALESGSSFEDSGTVDGSSSGTEGFVVFAVPMRAHKHQPDYSYLEQSGVGVGTRDVRRPPEGPQTPFETLMAGAAFGRQTRAVRRNIPSTPQMAAFSWYTLPLHPNLSDDTN